MDNLDRNFQSLTGEFKDKGKAARGLNIANSLILQHKEAEMAHLLRFHDPIGVYGQELIQRFEVDALIEYYNLLLIGVLAGYIPNRFSDELNAEIIRVLEYPPVKTYYLDYYPYKMTAFTLQYVKENNPVFQEADETTIGVFNEFVSLNRVLKRDKDLERFLGMLVSVSYSGAGIQSIIETLSSVEKLQHALASKSKSEIEMGVWGFIKYTTFLSQLKEMLELTEKYPLFQSSLWMLHGYYFDRINATMKSIFHTAFENLEKSLGSPQVFNSLTGELFDTKSPGSLTDEELKEYATMIVQEAWKDVEFVLDDKWGEPLKNYFTS